MNNKLFKHAVVLVTIVVMLCSFAFAAEINSLSCSEARDHIDMNVIFADDATKGVYIAYAAQKVDAGTAGAEVIGEDSFILGPIVAIFQAETEKWLKWENHGEPINPELIPEGYDYIVLKAGDNGAESTTAATFAAAIPEPVAKYNITFVNYDGTTLYEVEVAEGETPVYGGETPVKAADAQYTYTFAGWDNELAPVTGEATYTATFSETVNKYAVKFVNYDGTELQNTEVAYGETPAYVGETPTKADDEEFTYEFAAWSPAIVAVTGEATYTATFNAIAKEPEVEYSSTTTSATYNGTKAIIVRITGLDTTKVVTVDGVTAKYYTKTDGTLVHVACIPETGDATAISVTEGTPELMVYGDYTGDKQVKTQDLTRISQGLGGKTVTLPNGTTTTYALPSDLMDLHKLDTSANGRVDTADLTAIKQGLGKKTVTLPNGTTTTYSLETMKCYTK